MIVFLDNKKCGSRFEYVATDLSGRIAEDRKSAIEYARYFVWHEPSTESVHLVECECETLEEFYEKEDKEGGYSPFWDSSTDLEQE